MPHTSNINQVILMLYLRTFISAFVLSFIISKITKWRILKSIFIITTSKILSDRVIAPLLTTLPMMKLLPPIKQLVLFLTIYYTITILIKPFIHFAILKSISTLFLTQESKYNFGITAYLILVSFEVGVIIFKFATKYFLPSIMKYFYAY